MREIYVCKNCGSTDRKFYTNLPGRAEGTINDEGEIIYFNSSYDDYQKNENNYCSNCYEELELIKVKVLVDEHGTSHVVQ